MGTVFWIIDAKIGKQASARFCSISISPKAVPKSLGSTTMGTEGTIAVQNRAQQIPKISYKSTQQDQRKCN